MTNDSKPDLEKMFSSLIDVGAHVLKEAVRQAATSTSVDDTPPKGAGVNEFAQGKILFQIWAQRFDADPWDNLSLKSKHAWQATADVFLATVMGK